MKACFLLLALLSVSALTGCKTAYDLRQPPAAGIDPHKVVTAPNEALARSDAPATAGSGQL